MEYGKGTAKETFDAEGNFTGMDFVWEVKSGLSSPWQVISFHYSKWTLDQVGRVKKVMSGRAGKDYTNIVILK